MFPSTARNQYKKNFLRSSVVAGSSGTEKFLLKERTAAGHHQHSGSMLPKAMGYDAWNMKNNNSNISTIIDY
jgi:hypothetical protein